MKMLHSLFTLSLALLITACASADTDSLLMAEAWAQGKAIVVVFNSSADNTDETYGDAAYYLNEFAVEAGENWAFFTLKSQAGSSELPVDINVAVEPYSVLFVKQGQPQGYIHLGPILEPQVYDFIQRKFEGRDIPEYLYQFTPDMVQVRWDGQGRVLRVDAKP